MCAIVDANVAGKVFASKRGEAGKKFFEWINSGRGRLVVGGQLLDELNKTPFRDWARQAVFAGLIRRLSEDKIKESEEILLDQGQCNSNDAHVIALAQLSGARLLYTDDGNLHKDFKNKALINDPPGRVYSTKTSENFTGSHKRLLNRQDLCGQA